MEKSFEVEAGMGFTFSCVMRNRTPNVFFTRNQFSWFDEKRL